MFIAVDMLDCVYITTIAIKLITRMYAILRISSMWCLTSMPEKRNIKFHMTDLTPEEDDQLSNALKRTYDTILDEFLKSKKERAKIEIDNVTPATIYYGLKRAVVRRKLADAVEVRGLNRGVVLVRKQ